MNTTSVFNLVLFMISIMATCLQAEKQCEEYPKNKVTKRITKREAAVIIDNYPLDAIIKKKPQVVIRKIAKIKGQKSKSKYYRPTNRARPGKYSKSGKKIGSSKIKRMPTAMSPHNKKNKKPFYSYKHGSARRPMKSVNVHNSNFRKPYMFKPTRPAGFGEPPIMEFGSHFKTQPPLVDKYGAPLVAQPPREPHTLGDAPDIDYDMPPDTDTRFAFSNTHAKFVVPDESPFDNPMPTDLNNNNIGGYQNIFNLHNKRHYTFSQLNKKAPIINDFDMHVEEVRAERLSGDHEMVGGQYAEPPARFVPKSHTEELDFEELLFSPPDVFVNSKFAPSASISPYVNYKNGNIAFSPQNLNDAFSIIDK